MKHLFIILLFSLTIAKSYSQEKTLYEKKCYELTVEFFRQLGIDKSLLSDNKKLSDLEGLLVTAVFLDKINTEKGLLLLLTYDKAMNEAKKLKTAEDYKREKFKAFEEERKKQIEIAKQREAQKRREVEQREMQKKNEIEQSARKRKEYYDNSDLVILKQTIKQEFNFWSQKSEFEKTNDYQSRIQNKSAIAFDSICYKNVINAIAKKPKISLTLLKYNADLEKFGITFSSNGNTFTDSLKVLFNRAEKFKTDFNRFSFQAKTWSFIDNYLVPTKISIENNNDNYDFFISKTNSKHITFSSSDILSNNVTLNSIFDFDNYHLKQIQNAKVYSNDINNDNDYKDTIDYDKVYSTVQVPPMFPGDSTNFSKYLSRNLNADLPSQNGAPVGKYVVKVIFIVQRDGTITNVDTENNPNYGMKEEVIQVIAKGPKWIPAKQNGHNVASYCTRSITFVVGKEE